MVIKIKFLTARAMANDNRNKKINMRIMKAA